MLLKRLGKWLFSYSWIPLLLTLVFELVLFEIIGQVRGQPGFASLSTVLLILNQLSIFGIMAVGMTFVIMSAGIDLSIGSTGAITGVISAYLAVSWAEVSPYLVWLALGVGVIFGLINGLIMGSLVAILKIPPFIVTLAFMSLLRGLANLFTDGKPISPVPEMFLIPGRGMLVSSIPYSVVIFLAIFCFGIILQHYTSYGRYILAIGGNEESARLSGIPIRSVKLFTYALSGALAGVGGVILASRMGSGSPKVGVGDELAVIASVVIGGTSLNGGKGSLWGTWLGLCVVFTLNSGLNWIGVETFGQQVTLGVVILLAVIVDKFQEIIRET